MKDKSQLSGVGGWLALLVVFLTALSPIYGFGQLYGEIAMAESASDEMLRPSNWGSIKALSWASYWAGAIAGFIGGVVLLTGRTRAAVRSAIMCLWIRGPVVTVGTWVGLSFMANMSGDDPLHAKFIAQLVSSMVVAGSWTAYLMGSVRVKNTYGVTENVAPVPASA